MSDKIEQYVQYCPKCNSTTRIEQTGSTKKGIKRFRRCVACDNKYTTVEVLETEFDLMKKHHDFVRKVFDEYTHP